MGVETKCPKPCDMPYSTSKFNNGKHGMRVYIGLYLKMIFNNKNHLEQMPTYLHT